jgi:hypothetical protein
MGGILTQAVCSRKLPVARRPVGEVDSAMRRRYVEGMWGQFSYALATFRVSFGVTSLFGTASFATKFKNGTTSMDDFQQAGTTDAPTGGIWWQSRHRRKEM